MISQMQKAEEMTISSMTANSDKIVRSRRRSKNSNKCTQAGNVRYALSQSRQLVGELFAQVCTL